MKLKANQFSKISTSHRYKNTFNTKTLCFPFLFPRNSVPQKYPLTNPSSFFSKICLLTRLSQEDSLNQILSILVRPAYDSESFLCSNPTSQSLTSKATDLLCLNHPLINQFFFAENTPEGHEKIYQERIQFLIEPFNDIFELSHELIYHISRVLSSLKAKNHPELLQALLNLKADELFQAHLYSQPVVFDIIQDILVDLSFKNIKSVRHITSPGGEALTSSENHTKSKYFEILEDPANIYNKASERTEECSKKAHSIFTSKSQKSTSRISSITTSKALSPNSDFEKSNKDKFDFRFCFIHKLTEKFLLTTDDRIIANLASLFSNIVQKSRRKSNLRALLEDVFYNTRFQDKIFAILFQVKHRSKFEHTVLLLITLIDHHEDFFFTRNGTENIVKLSPPFYRFMNDCIEPMNEILSCVYLSAVCPSFSYQPEL